MYFVCFIQAATYGVADLFIPAYFRALMEDGRLCAKEEVLVPLPSKMRTDILQRGHSQLIRDCAVDSLSLILVNLLADEIELATPDCVRWLLYDFIEAGIISVS